MQLKPRHVAPYCLCLKASQLAPNILRTAYFFNLRLIRVYKYIQSVVKFVFLIL
jgi:hypothetical protein